MGAVPCKTSGDADSGSSFDVLDSVPVRFANEPRCLSLALLLQAFIMVCHTPNREGSMKEDANPLKRIEHIVVVMLENRSFDSLLGWLYDPANEAPFDIVPSDFEGLSGKRLSNPDVSGKEVPAGKTLDPHSPIQANLSRTFTARSMTCLSCPSARYRRYRRRPPPCADSFAITRTKNISRSTCRPSCSR